MVWKWWWISEPEDEKTFFDGDKTKRRESKKKKKIHQSATKKGRKKISLMFWEKLSRKNFPRTRSSFEKFIKKVWMKISQENAFVVIAKLFPPVEAKQTSSNRKNWKLFSISFVPCARRNQKWIFYWNSFSLERKKSDPKQKAINKLQRIFLKKTKAKQ